MFDSTTHSSAVMEGAPSRRIRTVAHTLLDAVNAGKDASWNVERARLLAGPRVSIDTCLRALKHLEHIGAIVESEPGVWRRRELWPGTQADWYT